MANFNDKFLLSFEKDFNVNYPKINSVTYKSLVNYASDLDLPIQRWYRYKEGYSIKLVDQILTKYNVKQGDLIVDPFCGSGSTLLQAKINKCNSIGFEINHFSAFLAKVKTQDYKKQDVALFIKEIANLKKVKSKQKVNIPKLSTIEQLFDNDALLYLLTLKEKINQIKSKKVSDLLMLAWLSILEESSNYRKAGNGLKFRKTIKKTIRDQEYVKNLFFKSINDIQSDLNFAVEISGKVNTSVIEDTCFNLSKYTKKNSIKGVIFSPPYANCFDYTEIYKVELWMGSFVSEYSDLKILRKKGIRSHLNGYEIESKLAVESVPELGALVNKLSSKKLWDKRIPKMVEAYFNDMFRSMTEIYNGLKKGGFCVIIVSNSAYGGVIVPTDLLLAKFAKHLGFNVSSIEVARNIITSSQQYKETEKYRGYLRESIIYLEKN
ncbi:MAG: site-specific DNA-methyltransferase [Candidatus Pacebacteria bacterium]|jgi:DNA modification methylase|nr:site-specific DNA-methyltransferase [Candidatus Paceibacterota bacterium]